MPIKERKMKWNEIKFIFIYFIRSKVHDEIYTMICTANDKIFSCIRLYKGCKCNRNV